MAVAPAVVDLLRRWVAAAQADDFDAVFDLSTDDLAESFLSWGVASDRDLLRRGVAELDSENLAIISNDQVQRAMAPNLEMIIVIKDPELIAAGVVGMDGPQLLTRDQATVFLVELTDDGWLVAQWSETPLQRYEVMFGWDPS